MDVRIDRVGMTYNDAGRAVEVLHELSLNVESGSTLAIVGESGIGKTTLLNLIGMLERPTSGDVYLGGQCVTRWSENAERATFRGNNIGFIFQFHYLLREFDALENVAMPLLIQGLDRASAYDRAEQLLNRVSLSARLKHRPAQLSGGEQQRVAIARALAVKPGLVLADEPTGNLDVHTAGEVQKLLLEVQREEKITLIVVTHSLELARQMDRVVELTPSGIVAK